MVSTDDLLPRWVAPAVCLVGMATAFATLFSTLPAHHWWGRIALGGYAVALVVTAIPSIRRWWWVVCVVACGLVPLLVLVIGRARGWHHVAQSEVDGIESAARRLLEHGTPYLDPDDLTARRAANTYSYFPYLPALAAAGLPRAIVGRHWFTDARLWMVATEVALGAITYRRISPRARAGFAALIASPLVLLLVTGGGHDVFIQSFVVLGAVGIAASLGAAAACSILAWPLVAPFGFQPRFDPRKVLIAVLVVAATAWPILVDPGAAWANLVQFPAGDTPAASPAKAPSIGRLLSGVPGGPAITVLLLGAVAVALAVSVIRRPPQTVGDAAGPAALAFLALTVLVPASRVGYLVHPAALGVLWWAGWSTTREPTPAPPR